MPPCLDPKPREAGPPYAPVRNPVVNDITLQEPLVDMNQACYRLY